MHQSTRILLIGPAALALLLTHACDREPNTDVTAEIVALERATLDRWIHGDPQGYLEIYAPEVTYFDPLIEKRIDGLPAMRDYLTPITGKVKADRYDLISPKVQRHGEAAVLTFSFVSYTKQPNGSETPGPRWNTTEVYAQVEGKWKIIHNHWALNHLKLPTQ